MSGKYILAIDAGSSSVRTLVINQDGQIVGEGRAALAWNRRKPGWAELDAALLWSATRQTIVDAVLAAKIQASQIVVAGIASHRETIVMWDKKTGAPVHDALVWISTQTDQIVEGWNQSGLGAEFKGRTGLHNDSFFSAGKVVWLLENIKGLRTRVKRGEILVGTVDSWLLWNLNGRQIHATDPSCASRTALFNIHTMGWDSELLAMLDIPEILLPKILDSDGEFGEVDRSILDSKIPIRALLADQQSGMFGQACFAEGSFKNTFGTASVLTVNIGERPKEIEGLTTSVGWRASGQTIFEAEGVVFHSGQTVQWLRDNLGIYAPANRINEIATSVSSNAGVYLVPALGGLAAPHWDRKARASVHGLSLDASGAHLVRAAVEAMAFQTADIVEKLPANLAGQFRVDGGGATSDFLCQFLADITNMPIERPVDLERTALGTAFVAGIAIGIWSGQEEIANNWRIERIFQPSMDEATRSELVGSWKNAVGRTLSTSSNSTSK